MIARPLESSLRVSKALAIFNGCISKGLTARGPSSILLVLCAAGMRLMNASHC